jgi:hypothetical protein
MTTGTITTTRTNPQRRFGGAALGHCLDLRLLCHQAGQFTLSNGGVSASQAFKHRDPAVGAIGQPINGHQDRGQASS